MQDETYLRLFFQHSPFGVNTFSCGIFSFLLSSLIHKTKKIKRLVLVGCFLYFLFSLFLFKVKTPFDFYVVQFFLGFAMALQIPSFDAIYTKAIKGGSSGYKWAFHTSAFYISAALGALSGGHILTYSTWHRVFVFIATMSLLSFLVALFFIKEEYECQNT